MKNFTKFRHQIIWLFLGIIILILLILGFIVFTNFSKKVSEKREFKVENGQGTRDIAGELKEQNLIASPWIFSFYVWSKHWYLQVGSYEIAPGMRFYDIARLMHDGKVKEYTVTIPEGWRTSQIDELLASRGIVRKGEFLKIASSDEGYLFPDTYSFSLDVTPEAIRKVMLDNFQKKTVSLKVTREQVILASIVEREAKLDADRSRIAKVYLNRLDRGMRLEADPTIQYAKGNWEPITRSDYHNFQSPYNTYLNSGLPPGPICNPGLKSIKAVLNPDKTGGYLFFYHKSNGEAVFAKTLEEHEANVQKYR